MNLTTAIIYFETYAKNLDRKNPRKVTAIQYEDGSREKFNVQFDGGDWEFHRLPTTEDAIELAQKFVGRDNLTEMAGWKRNEAQRHREEAREIRDMNYLWEFYERKPINISINNIYADAILKYGKAALLEMLEWQASRSDMQAQALEDLSKQHQ